MTVLVVSVVSVVRSVNVLNGLDCVLFCSFGFGSVLHVGVFGILACAV